MLRSWSKVDKLIMFIYVLLRHLTSPVSRRRQKTAVLLDFTCKDRLIEPTMGGISNYIVGKPFWKYHSSHYYFVFLDFDYVMACK